MISHMTEIKNLISTHRPLILGISEANIPKNEDIKLFSVKDYTVYPSPCSESGIIRLVIYAHKDVMVKVRNDLSSPNLSSVWLEAGLKNHKKFLINQYYREWQQLGVQDSDSIPEQLSRWIEHLDIWERAISSGKEVISLGDYNLNHCNWTDPNISRSCQTYKMRPLINVLFSRIFPHGISQMVTGPTRHFPGQISSGLDHFYTNMPNKITSVEKHFCGSSDHMLITAIRKCKSIRNSPQYIRKRSYKHFNKNLFKEAIQRLSWLDVYLMEDVNEAVQAFTNKILNVLDNMAPMKTFQVRHRHNPWVSQETLDMMKMRDQLQKEASESNCQYVWAMYKELRNKVNNRLKYEEKSYHNKRLSEGIDSPLNS